MVERVVAKANLLVNTMKPEFDSRTAYKSLYFSGRIVAYGLIEDNHLIVTDPGSIPGRDFVDGH